MRRGIGIALLLAAVLQLGYRGMQRVRVDVPAWDFASVYAAGRHWMHGGDPYDLPGVVTTWKAAGSFADRDVSYFATVYPPSSLVVVMPLAVLPSAPAMILWLLLTAALLAVQFVALADMAGLTWRDPRTLLLVGAGLAAAPLQFGVLSGQLSIPAISLCVIAFWLAGRDRDTLAGLLLGLACAIKPQVAGPFVVYYLALRRFKLATFACAIGAAIWVVALGAMLVTHIHWIDGWQHSVALTTQPGGVNDYGWANRFRDEITDLKLVVVGFVHSPQLLRAGVVCIVAVLLACYVGAFPRGRRLSPHDELLPLAGLGALLLLPVYHRVYDVALLTTALAWALAELDGPRRRSAGTLLLCLSVFLIPFDSVKSVGTRVHRLGSLTQKWWWQSLVLPHYAWALLATTIVILAIMSQRKREMELSGSEPLAGSRR